MPESRVDIARAALREITLPETIGDYLGEESAGDSVVNLTFGTPMPGYPGWRWVVSVAVLDGESPHVLETELIPGEGALLAPEWIPWVDRMDDYLAAQAAIAEADASDEESDDDADDDLDDLDDDSDDDVPLLHGGDIDGVDIDPDPDDEPDDDDDVDDDDEADDDEYAAIEGDER